MIFVTVGNAFQPFHRLLAAVDALAAGSVFREDRVVMQIGHDSRFSSQHAETKPFLPMQEFDRLMTEADLVICHGGCTVFQALRLDKVPVVMPRQAKFGEHINDHQVQFVRALAEEGCVIPVYEADALGAAVEEARRRQTSKKVREPSAMPALVGQAIAELMA